MQQFQAAAEGEESELEGRPSEEDTDDDYSDDEDEEDVRKVCRSSLCIGIGAWS